MATKIQESTSPATGSPWYGKLFECWRNRNRISPGKVELADCDFFIVAPRRTLRVLKPSLESAWYYESTMERPESINDNFFARWSKRPHPFGNCRCSFRRSVGALSATEERIISAELNRIRTSLCEVEKDARHMEELERRVSMNLEKLRNDSENHPDKESTSDDNGRFCRELSAKRLIVKDLERYINALLEEILDDTVKYIAAREDDAPRRGSEVSHVETDSYLQKWQPDELKAKRSIDIDPSVLADTMQERCGDQNQCKKEFIQIPTNGAYVNRAFVGSNDSLDLNRSTEKYARLYVGISPNTETIALEALDCVDSGINSVETVEFQSDQEPSFEQSLLRIIDEKLGRAYSTHNFEEDSMEKKERKIHSDMRQQDATDCDEIPPCSFESSTDNSRISETVERFGNVVNVEAGFEKLRLEFQSIGKDSSLNSETLSKLNAAFDLDARLIATTSIELEKDYKKEWAEFDEIYSQTTRNLADSSIILRKNKKPTIVFLHGFGSSADIFKHQLKYFSSLGYPCIAPDMLGHGMSSAPGQPRDYHFGKLLKDLDAVLHYYAFKTGEKCVLVAHNYGCSFATALAYKYDSNIHQLVLISGGGPTALAPPSTESAGHCCLRAVFAPLLMCGLHRDILYSARGRQHPYCGQESIEQWPSHMKHVLNGMIWPEGDYVFHRRICTPTLLVHGLRDNKVSLVQECQMERTMVKAFLEAIPMAGHNPMTDCPQQLNHMIHCFIDLWKNKKWQQ